MNSISVTNHCNVSESNVYFKHIHGTFPDVTQPLFILQSIAASSKMPRVQIQSVTECASTQAVRETDVLFSSTPVPNVAKM